MRKALSYPLRLIANNAGVNGSVVQQRVLENLDQSIGYNAATDKYEDLMAAGIIDPTKVRKSQELHHQRLQAQPPCCGTRPVSSLRLARRRDICLYLLCHLHLAACVPCCNFFGSAAIGSRSGSYRLQRMLQVLRVAMLNAASVARTFLTSDVIITEIPQPEAAGAAGGMDAMGGY